MDELTPRVERKLAAVLAADIAGYSGLMGADEEATVRDLKKHQSVILPMIASCGAGTIVSRQNTAGIGITQSVNGIQIRTSEVAAPRNCTYSGSYAQNGQVADVQGPGLRIPPEHAAVWRLL